MSNVKRLFSKYPYCDYLPSDHCASGGVTGSNYCEGTLLLGPQDFQPHLVTVNPGARVRHGLGLLARLFIGEDLSAYEERR